MTLYASFGQNSLIQVEEFLKFIEIDSVILTKMDGTAKGGIVFPLYKNLNVPVSFLGLGEDVDNKYNWDKDTLVMGMNLKDIYKQIPKDTDAIGLNLNFSFTLPISW